MVGWERWLGSAGSKQTGRSERAVHFYRCGYKSTREKEREIKRQEGVGGDGDGDDEDGEE